ncbi:uncharacterized protein B0H18DRAFT_1136832 [Fomitopsis serialis]|uniref:uncharacterized protein n=1 Tax=Fomitopsis serialis TaxID=139415 RepID=UPI00200773BC|nr:uncharacterized protein B0H18DRAFT_1136832 [Neoantrodia serialis]KAH9917036.1 hypothetical protein B0H18DRAFT_1136832 [Neoantrodia serialis]
MSKRMSDGHERLSERVSRAQICNLPCELRDTVIDLLHTDHGSLKACSLTCRAWLPRARYHLFRTISIDRGRTGDAFAHLLRSSPTISTHIQDVEINGSQSQSNWWTTDHRKGMFPWPTLGPPTRGHTETDLTEADTWLRRILPEDTHLLAKVKSLRISALPLGGTLTVALQPHFENVKVLSVDGCKALAFGDFITFLRAFPHLESLHLLAIQWLPGRSHQSEECAKSLPRMRSLELSHKVDAAPFVSWLIDEEAHSEVTSLNCSVSGQKCASAISQLLKALGPTLRRFVVGFRETGDGADVLRKSALELTHSTGLRSLRIQCSTASSTLLQSSYRPSLSWIVILLATANSSLLKELTISISASDLCALNMEGLDVVLSHVRYGGLERVIFEIDFQKQPMDRSQISRVSTRMVAVWRRGLLRFVVVGTDANGF